MLCLYWLFVFSVHHAHSLRSNALQNGYQNSYSTNGNRNGLNDGYGESNWKELTANSGLTLKSKSGKDQLLAEESGKDDVDRSTADSSSMDDYSLDSHSKKYKKQQPYSFGYESHDGWGTKMYRHEKKQGKAVTGSYGYVDKDGYYRHVTYRADELGFRAKVKTNEPGTSSKNSADVEMEAMPMQPLSSNKNSDKLGQYKSTVDAYKQDADLLTADNNGNTALHIAIQVAQKTRTKSCRVSTETACSESGNQRTMLTIEKNDQNEYLKIVELILSSAHSTAVNSTVNEQRTMFNLDDKSNYSQRRTVANERNNQTADELNQQSRVAELVNMQNRFGKTPLHYCCYLKPDQYSIKLITILLKSKANPDIADFRNCTPLFYLLAEHQAEHQIDHRSKSENVVDVPRKCSKNCSIRSPFIDLLISYKCDKLNLDELDYGIATLQQLCRKTIQKHSAKMQLFQSTLSNGSQMADNGRNGANMNYQQLPDSLYSYLCRRTL